MATQTLKQSFDEFRKALDCGERAFELWQNAWTVREKSLERRLAALNDRVMGAPSRPRLRLAVLAD